eukprot:1835096-Amphidinium_carterae.1
MDNGRRGPRLVANGACGASCAQVAEASHCLSPIPSLQKGGFAHARPPVKPWNTGSHPSITSWSLNMPALAPKRLRERQQWPDVHLAYRRLVPWFRCGGTFGHNSSTGPLPTHLLQMKVFPGCLPSLSLVASERNCCALGPELPLHAKLE